MKTLREFLAALEHTVTKDPTLLDLPCVFTDDQCCHYEASGNVFRTEVEDWPDEYCIEDSLPNGCKEFARIC